MAVKQAQEKLVNVHKNQARRVGLRDVDRKRAAEIRASKIIQRKSQQKKRDQIEKKKRISKQNHQRKDSEIELYVVLKHFILFTCLKISFQ